MVPEVKVKIVDYNPEWSKIYAREECRVKEAIGGYIRSIDHIGSTSVNGLGAKPIIDIMVGVDSREIADLCQDILEDYGYNDVTDQPGHDEWFYCLGRGNGELYYHLHLVLDNSAFHRKHIIFRDYLREHPERAQEYYLLKRKLSEQLGSNRRAYTEAKTNFIEETVQRAIADGS